MSKGFTTSISKGVQMTSNKANMAGWVQVERKHYRHTTGREVRYSWNHWSWEVIGGRNDGYSYGALWVAVHAALQ